MNQLLLDVAPFYIVFCFIVAFLYSWLMYSKHYAWGKSTNYFFSILRFLVVFFLCFLLMGPHIRLSNFQKEKPKVVIGIDNSESLPLITKKEEIQNHLKKLQTLTDLDYDFSFFDLNSKIETLDELAFTNKVTNLTSLLSHIYSEFENQNLAAIVLYSDGIANRGMSPLFLSSSKPIYTVGIGDTTARKDIAVKSVLSNKIAYQGNFFPISVEIIQNGFQNQSINLSLKGEKGVISKKTLSLSQSLTSTDFLVEAESEGIKSYTLSIEPVNGEFSVNNNSKTIFIEVLKSKQKILLIGAAVHPDMKAIKAAIETNQNYELITYLPQLEAANQLEKPDLNQNFDLVVSHQLPALNGVNTALLQKFLALKVPIWFVLGSTTDYSAFNRLNLAISFKENSFRADRVFGLLNSSFASFTLDEKWAEAISAFPPVLTNFGGVLSRRPLQVLIFQKIGTLNTQMPLLAIEPETKMAFFMAEGLWQWRMECFRSFGNHDVFDKIISKMVLYLANKEDKRKFRVYPLNSEISDSEPVKMVTEVYNDLYEKIYTQSIELNVTDGKSFNRSYSYTNQQGSKFELGTLPFGIYSYQAKSVLNGKTETAEGKFIVSRTQMEDIITQANFNLLRELSAKTGGKFYKATEIDQLKQELVSASFKTKIHSQESTDYLINLWWILLALAFMASLEWALRKYNGTY